MIGVALTAVLTVRLRGWRAVALRTRRTVRRDRRRRVRRAGRAVAPDHPRQNGYGILSTPAELAGFTGDATLLTDDYAPVDQLLTPTRG